MRLFVTSSLWFIRRPFVISRARLHLTAGICLLAAVLIASYGQFLAAVAPALLGFVLVAASVHWAWLVRGDIPVVLLTAFRAPSKVGRGAADSHIAALRRFLEEDEDISDSGPVAVRVIDVPVSDAAAKRLLTLDRVVMVVRGTGDSGLDSSHWDARVWFGDGGSNVRLTTRPHSIYVDRAQRRRMLFRSRSGAQSSRVAEGDLPTRKFFAAVITVGHFRDIAKVMLVLLGEAFLARDGPQEPRILRIPVADDQAIGANMQGEA